MARSTRAPARAHEPQPNLGDQAPPEAAEPTSPDLRRPPRGYEQVLRGRADAMESSAPATASDGRRRESAR